MTKNTKKKAKKNMPKIGKNANDQLRENPEPSSISTRAKEIDDNIRDRLQTQGLNTDTDQPIEISDAVIAPTLARTLATIEKVSTKLEVLESRVEEVLEKQIIPLQTVNYQMRKLYKASKKRDDILKQKVDDIKGTLDCVHSEFHATNEDEEQMNMHDRLSYITEMTENFDEDQEVVGALKEGFSTWRIAEKADRKDIKRGVEKLGGKIGELEEKMKGFEKMIEKFDKILEVLEKVAGKENKCWNTRDERQAFAV